jgi:hypothetical protein
MSPICVHGLTARGAHPADSLPSQIPTAPPPTNYRPLPRRLSGISNPNGVKAQSSSRTKGLRPMADQRVHSRG